MLFEPTGWVLRTLEACKKCGGTGKILKWRIDSGVPRGGVSGYQGRSWPETCSDCNGKKLLKVLVIEINKIEYPEWGPDHPSYDEMGQ